MGGGESEPVVMAVLRVMLPEINERMIAVVVVSVVAVISVEVSSCSGGDSDAGAWPGNTSSRHTHTHTSNLFLACLILGGRSINTTKA